MKKRISNKMSSGSTKQKFGGGGGVIFASITFKLENVGPTFSSSNTCLSLPSPATDDRKQFQCLSTVLNIKLDQFVRNSQLSEKMFQRYGKDSK